MKRLWQGTVLLLFLLAAGLAVSSCMGRIHRSLSQELNRAAEAAVSEDWDSAELHFHQARQIWQKSRRFTAAFADHGPIDDMNSLFASSRIYLHQKSPDFPAVCSQLARLAEAMGSSQSVSWWNLM